MLDFEGTKEELADQVVIPEFAQIQGDGKRRRNRRRVGAVAAAVAVVALAAAVVPLAQGRLAGVQSADPLAGAVAGPVAGAEVLLTGAPVTLSWYGELDTREALAVTLSEGKAPSMARTVDGGHTWKAWRLPPGIGVTTGDQLIQTGSTLNVVYPQVISRTVVQIGNYLSRDAGQTWTKTAGTAVNGVMMNHGEGNFYTAVIAAPVPSAPTGWPVRAFCVDNNKAGIPATCGMYAIDPVEGGWHPFAKQPSTTWGDAEGAVDASGRLWFSHSAESKCILSSSVDHGATWTTLSIDKADGCAGVPMSGTDGTAYATLSGLLASIPPSVLVSHDGWKTWQKTQLGTPPVDLIAVLPDGALLAAPRHVTSPGKPATSAAPGFLLSRDGGKTFQQIAGTAGFSSLKTTAVGSYIGSSNSGEPGKQSISDDGEHWSKAPQVPGQK
ncbi:hypothetical protein GCM10009765_13180 [Fodinicola feengrottensis]|uniref:Exo-alpha-sialidase n=2 Tax=Fodinicola feengrottensis TaxID=435914 RepID=A0ABN2G403_9ACTN